MPDRTIPTRAPISRTSTMATSTRTVSDRTPISGSRLDMSGRGVTTDAAPAPLDQSSMVAVSNAILSNASNYGYLARAIGPPYSGTIGTVGSTSANAGNGNSTVDTNNPQTGGSPYDLSSPLGLLGDAFNKAFGGSTYNPQPQQPDTIVQPVGTSNSGGTLGILLILGGIGFAIYWFYFRHKHGG